MRKLSDEYIAAFFDGEGSIVSNPYRLGRRALDINITNTHSRVLRSIEKSIKPILSNFCVSRKASNTTQEVWRIQITNRKSMISFLKRMLPYLVVKREQALLTLDFLALSDNMYQARRNPKGKTLLIQIKKLKKYKYLIKYRRLHKLLKFKSQRIKQLTLRIEYK